jgi:hypothetical protein
VMMLIAISMELLISWVIYDMKAEDLPSL